MTLRYSLLLSVWVDPSAEHRGSYIYRDVGRAKRRSSISITTSPHTLERVPVNKKRRGEGINTIYICIYLCIYVSLCIYLYIDINIDVYAYTYLRALPFFLVQQGCLRVGVSRCGLAVVVGGGVLCFVGVNLSSSLSGQSDQLHHQSTDPGASSYT